MIDIRVGLGFRVYDPRHGFWLLIILVTLNGYVPRVCSILCMAYIMYLDGRQLLHIIYMYTY